jgi:hypothetical protein
LEEHRQLQAAKGVEASERERFRAEIRASLQIRTKHAK